MELNINIEQIVADAVGAALTPEKLQPIITSNVEKAVKSAIDDAFGYRAEFTELLGRKVKAAMPTDIENMGRFGDLVLKTVSAYLNEHQQEFIRQAIEPKLAGMLRKLPPRMKLTELVNMLVEGFADRMDHERDGASQPTFIVERSSGVVGGYWHFYADPRSSVSKYSCRIQADFTDEGVCYSLKVHGEDLQKKLIIGPTFSVDALMLNLYTGGIVVELDQDDFSDLYYPDSSED